SPTRRSSDLVDLDRIDMPGGIRELVPLPQPLWVEDPAPARVVPAGKTDANLSSPSCHLGKTPNCPGCRGNAMRQEPNSVPEAAAQEVADVLGAAIGD